MIILKIFEWDALNANNLAIKYYASFPASLENQIRWIFKNIFYKFLFSLDSWFISYFFKLSKS